MPVSSVLSCVRATPLMNRTSVASGELLRTSSKLFIALPLPVRSSPLVWMSLVQQRLHGLVYDAPNSLTNDDEESRKTRVRIGRSTQTPQT